MDNKKFAIPTSSRAKRYVKMVKVRGHLRTRAEGIKKHFTKPKSTKHKVNPGAHVNVCAVIINCRVAVWQYLPSRWCGEVARDLYSDPLIKALREHRGIKAVYKTIEDNDPTGYKCNIAKKAKKRSRHRARRFSALLAGS